MKEEYLIHYGVKGQKWGVIRYLDEKNNLSEKKYNEYKKELSEADWYDRYKHYKSDMKLVRKSEIKYKGKTYKPNDAAIKFVDSMYDERFKLFYAEPKGSTNKAAFLIPYIGQILGIAYLSDYGTRGAARRREIESRSYKKKHNGQLDVNIKNQNGK